MCQKYILKIHSERLRRSRWKLTLPLSEARKNEEVISLADSQILRWIDELNGVVDADAKAKAIKSEIAHIRKDQNSLLNRRRIKQLYSELDEIQFKPDYMCLIIDKEKDYWRACKGFSINGVKYVRLLGTNGGVKNETIVFVSARLAPELRRRIDNGRNPDVPMVPAKLESYKALTCSASVPVSMPHGVIVVDDCMTEFTTDIVYLNDEDDGEPVMETRNSVSVELDESDGYGLMLPSLAARWSEELDLDYTVSGANTRMSWEKGMAFTFDFVEFADQVAGKYVIKDAWGDERDVRDAELILTTSMLKLWDSYDSCEDYLENCTSNGYTFGLTKTCPKVLESERTTNYQFIQSYNLTDDDIEELIEPTMTSIKEVLGADPMKTSLFLNGSGMNDNNIERMPNGYVKAIMIDPALVNDPYIQSCVYRQIRNRINEAKVGVLNVHGNYSIVCGDPYSLCQSIFGLPVTGLLKSGEIYNKYWVDSGAENLACFRAPMTCHNNIRLVHPHRSAEAEHWYQYMTTCTLFNSWDTCAMALNGMDKDGDLVMLTDNKVLVGKLSELPALMCIQRKAAKKVVTEDDAIQANINSFGDDIGRTTNYITSMFEVQSHFDDDSEEYKVLDYRIRCGQLYQQNAIDKAKGIICKPMPREWFDHHAANKIEDQDERRMYQSIVAAKKPYFMRYIYPELMSDYNTYIQNANRNSMREFGMKLDDLLALPEERRTERQSDFVRYYHKSLPVGIGNCVMNKICRRFEEEFDHYLGAHNANIEFDYSILKSGCDYDKNQYYKLTTLYREYNKRCQSYILFTKYERVDEGEKVAKLLELRNDFMRECQSICQNKDALCDMLIDICYSKNSSKRFAWDMCGDEIVENLLAGNNGIISFPVLDADGDIVYVGNTYTVHRKKIEVEHEHRSE